jgi:nucleoside-diphosphate-sugar epimerase
MREFTGAVADYFKYEVPTIPDFIAFIGAYMLGVLKIIGINVPLYPFRLRNIKANYCYDIGKLLKLGYFPAYNLQEGMKETLNWYMNNDSAFQDL